MKEFLSHLHLAQPLFLLLFLLLPLFWLRLRARSLAVVVWRSLILALLILALAEPERVDEVTTKEERVFAFDLSRSIPGEMRLWMEKSARERWGVGRGDRTIVFAGETRQVPDWDRWVRGNRSVSSIKPEQTNLEALFSTVLNLPQAPRMLFLFSDGWQTEGSAERLISSLGTSGLRVFPMLPSDRPAIANVAVSKIIAPHQGTSGEGVHLRVVLENQGNREVEGSLTLKRNGRPLKTEEVKVKPGSQIFSFEAVLSDASLSSFQVDFVPRQGAADLFSHDNRATTWIAVGSKEKVLLLNGRSGEGRYLEELLKRRGFEVTSRVVDSSPPSPSGYSLVIFNNAERERFSAAYLAAIERHVASGNGFLMLGAEGSFGPGGYRRTPIETLLPVELKEPKKEEKNRAVILVIDKSGSMKEQNRLLYAKEAAKAVAGQLKEKDLLGVIGFDIEPFVVVPLAPVERLRGDLAFQIDRLLPAGRTYLYPAMMEAKRQLERQSAGRKHVIILSDGETGGSASDYVDLANVMRKELKMTVSAVAIGEQVNIPLLKRIAQYGGGFFHHTYDPTNLPQIVLQQLQEKPEEKQAPKEYVPLSVRGSEILAGLAVPSYPPLRGYIETEIKRGGRLDLVIPREGKRDPLLASWGYGKGKAVAFTTDLSGGWSGGWIRWEALERFWGKVFEWLRPPKESLPLHEVRINLVSGKPAIDLYIYSEGSEASRFRYLFDGKGGKGEGELKRLAPGHYQASLPITSPGDYRIDLVEERPGKRLSYPPIGYTLPSSPKGEMPMADFNIPLLEKLARSTGGAINPEDPSRLETQRVVRTAYPLRSYLIFLAPVLFLLEVIFRRFFLNLDAV